MKKIVGSAIIVLGLSGNVMAGGDIAPVVPAAADSWSGFYIGAEAGYHWGNADIDLHRNYAADAEINGFDLDGATGGLYVGYQFLTDGGYVFGLEAEALWLSGADERLNNPSSPQYDYILKQKWEAALYGKAGKVINDTFMPYVLAGVAWTKVEGTWDWKNGSNNWETTDSDTAAGWTVGTGIEMKLTENLHARLQYRYSDYGSLEMSHSNGAFRIDEDVDLKTHNVTLGISYRF